MNDRRQSGCRLFPLVAILLASVAGCEKPPGAPSKQIFHIRNSHFVAFNDFAADMRDQIKEPIADETLKSWYDTFLDDVETLQRQQVTMLRELIAQHNIRAVFYEGVTEKNIEAFRTKVRELKETDVADMERRFEEAPDEESAAVHQLLLNEYRDDVLKVGAVGRLMITGELVDVLPLDDAKLMETTNPLRSDGSVKFDEAAIAEREHEMIRRILSAGSVVVFVLGGDHDLREQIKADCPGCVLTVLAPEKLDSMNAVE